MTERWSEKDHPKSRWHQEETPTGRQSWACLPVADAADIAFDLKRLRVAAEAVLADADLDSAHRAFDELEAVLRDLR